MLHSKIQAFIFVAAATMIITACSEKEGTISPAGRANVSFREYIAGESNTTIFNAAFRRSGLEQDSAYLSGGPYTFFVPVDSAFTAQAMPLEVVNAMDKTKLLEILKYMTVKGRVSSSTLAGFFRQSATTLTDRRPILTKNYYGIFFNGIAMKEANINLGDAVVHKMNRLALPPKDSVLALIAGTPELSIFSAIITRSLNSGYEPHYGDVRNMFRTNGKTIFAPTNQAFINYGIPSVEYVKNIADTQMLASLVKTQVYTGSYAIDPDLATDNSAFSCTVSDFKGGFMLKGLGRIYMVLYPSVREDGLTIMTAVNNPNPRIVKTDLLAADGVVQEVDQVLLLK
ncbi:fasciclin domain-containing protein [Chitinophaga sp. 22620]|uniref:fasciclin domain-containing protein n=1 Tax=Chitinophaga sp. 22620 TaxID=3453952 RepID=UPI003F86C28E